MPAPPTITAPETAVTAKVFVQKLLRIIRTSIIAAGSFGHRGFGPTGQLDWTRSKDGQKEPEKAQSGSEKPVLQNLLGYWWGNAVLVPVLGLCGSLLWRARNRQRRNRLGRAAAATGSFEGWLRHPNALPDSLRRRWGYGTSRLTGGALEFQLLSEPDGPPLGRPSTYAELVRLGIRDVPTREAMGRPRLDPRLSSST